MCFDLIAIARLHPLTLPSCSSTVTVLVIGGMPLSHGKEGPVGGQRTDAAVGVQEERTREAEEVTSDFLKGWRRKTGLPLLAMALVLAGLWCRSVVWIDDISFRANGDVFGVRSGRGMLRLVWEPNSPWEIPGPFSHTINLNCDANKDAMSFDPEYWESQKLGVVWVIGYNKPTANTVANGWRAASAELYWLRVPYWSLMLPLTLLSAWLILAKPRRVTTTPPILTA
jgi:hypothetical protein